MENKRLTIIARILTKPEKREFVKAELFKLLEPTRAELGCINYNLHQDNENENLFMFYENWENKELWQKHMGNDHIAEYLKVTENSVEEFILHQLTPL